MNLVSCDRILFMKQFLKTLTYKYDGSKAFFQTPLDMVCGDIHVR